ncbi:MAG: hypothetical protein KGI94_01785 [Paracoccaceae bacterium]|nr:hypothetical protein [Paracoccaceae bacterium]MDE3120856.1 hypothetical protein [Paracoccaceae bacterium]MDE3240387.1 hypothetical protein [Paracoccaceae bacterium]
MARGITEADVVAAVPLLTKSRLHAWVAAEVVTPRPADDGPRYGERDVARLTLACELCEEFALADDALALVLTLVDRLHGAEADLTALAQALAAEPEDVRRRVGALLVRRG